MEKIELIERLKALVSQEDLLALNKEAHELKAKFAHILMAEEKANVQESESEETEEENTESEENAEAQDTEAATEETAEEATEELQETVAAIDADPLNAEFDALYETFKARHKEQVEAKRAIEQTNLEAKKVLIERLRKLIQEEENIGVAFNTQKEIQEQWREVGDIPRDLRQDIQGEYSRLLEQFYYNIGIYKELREHDLKRNQQLKEDIIDKLKKLGQNANLQEVETELKVLQHEWEDIGGTFQEVWEELKASYWSIVKSLYDRIRNHYEAKRAEMNKNLDAKRELLAQAEQVLAESLEKNDHVAFDEGTKQLLSFQEAWKGIGFGPRKENEEIWNAFRGVCDKFFETKNAYYKERNKQFDDVIAKKKAIIAQVNELKDSTDWKNTGHKIIGFQKDWKNLGHAGPRNEQKLWKEFRAACDGFFNKKDAHFAEMDAANTENLDLKKALIVEIEAFQLKENKQDSLADLRAFSMRFSEIGNVPFKEKDAIYGAFKGAMDKHYQSLDLKGSEKEKVMYSARLETIASSPESGRLYDDERRKLRTQIQKAEQDIRQYENNMGFFSKTTKNNPLMKTVEKNIEAAKKVIADCKAKLKQIPNE
jgi:hypothetical protein